MLFFPWDFLVTGFVCFHLWFTLLHLFLRNPSGHHSYRLSWYKCFMLQVPKSLLLKGYPLSLTFESLNEHSSTFFNKGEILSQFKLCRRILWRITVWCWLSNILWCKFRQQNIYFYSRYLMFFPWCFHKLLPLKSQWIVNIKCYYFCSSTY